MLALNGGIRIWHISDVVDMRYGKYRLLKVIEEKHLNPFNGDAYVFLSRNRKTLKILRYDCDKVVLYDISYMKGYKFMKPVFKVSFISVIFLIHPTVIDAEQLHRLGQLNFFG